MRKREICLEPPSLTFSGESRYLTPLQVFGNSDTKIIDLEFGADKVDPDHQKQDKITAALKLLTFREQHVLVQFWSPHEFGKHRLLTTIGEPFGFGVTDVGLSLYRQDSEERSFIVDKGHEEGDRSPATRVFGGGLPEWTSDLDNYTPKHFPQQECAIRCNLHGYLALPVFDSTIGLCVGVLELLTSSKYTSYAYEVQQLHNALEKVDLRTPKPFDRPTMNVPNDRRQNDFNKIHGILKMVCGIHNLHLAQTWSVSQQSSFVSHEKVIEKSCSSFDVKCVGKVCMSRVALPFHVHDLRTWPFVKACREQHLDMSRGFVGKALLSHGSCFCGDVTKLSEEEYPLVHHARMNRLSSCFAIFLRSIEADEYDDYVLEFFLPPDIKDRGHLLNLVQTLKQKVEITSGFELGDSSCIQVLQKPSNILFGLSFAVFLMIRVKRWSCSIKRHGFSGQWWSCGKHSYIPSKSDFIYRAARLIVQLRRWRNKKSMRNVSRNRDHHAVSVITTKAKHTINIIHPYSRVAKSSLVHASPKQTMANMLDVKMVTVKATFNEDMIKFQFPTSSGLLELEHEVARRIKIESRRLRLTYMDEDNDLILLACDADLQLLLRFTTNHSTIKLIIMADD